MTDFEKFVRSLADEDRSEMISRLIAADAAANKEAAVGSRARRGTADHDRAEEAKQKVERFGRIIYFLRFRSAARGYSAADIELCELLAAKLESKGQWSGKFSAPAKKLASI